MAGSGGIHPNWDYKGKVGKDVDREGDVLPEMEDLVAEYVSTERYGDCGDDEESGLPSGKCVGCVVDGDEGLNDSADEENSNCVSCLPGHG